MAWLYLENRQGQRAKQEGTTPGSRGNVMVRVQRSGKSGASACQSI